MRFSDRDRSVRVGLREAPLLELTLRVVAELGERGLLANALGVDHRDPLHEVILERRDLAEPRRTVAKVRLELEKPVLEARVMERHVFGRRVLEHLAKAVVPLGPALQVLGVDRHLARHLAIVVAEDPWVRARRRERAVLIGLAVGSRADLPRAEADLLFSKPDRFLAVNMVIESDFEIDYLNYQMLQIKHALRDNQIFHIIIHWINFLNS